MQLNNDAFLDHKMIELSSKMVRDISPNFRLIWMAICEPYELIITFVLEQELERDLEAIEDIALDFEAIQIDPLDFDIWLEITDEPMQKSPSCNLSHRIVYQRREVFSGRNHLMPDKYKRFLEIPRTWDV